MKKKGWMICGYIFVGILICFNLSVLFYIMNVGVTKVYTPMPDYSCAGLKQILNGNWANIPTDIKMTEVSKSGIELIKHTYGYDDYRQAYFQKC